MKVCDYLRGGVLKKGNFLNDKNLAFSSGIYRIFFFFFRLPEGTIWNFICAVGRLGYRKGWKFMVGSPWINSRHSSIAGNKVKFLTRKI